MFDELPDHWTPLFPAAELRDKPRPFTVAGEKVVLWRAPEGVQALVDRCPHRGVQLSLGKVTGGCLECPFHGWRFDGTGTTRHIPLNPGVVREHAAVPLPVRERAGLVWLYTGLDSRGTEPTIPPALERPHTRITFVQEEWATHWTRAMENMLDSPHLPYVHRATIGRSMAARMRPDSRAHQDLKPSDRGFELYFAMDDGERARIDWLRPNGMELHILEKPGAFLRTHSYCIPTKPGHTSMLVVSAQDFGWMNPFLFLGDAFNGKVLKEDKAVVESSGPDPVPAPSEEVNVPTDRPTLYFRRWYHEGRGRPLSGADEDGRRAG